MTFLTRTRLVLPTVVITPSAPISGDPELDAILLEEEHRRADLEDAKALEATALLDGFDPSRPLPLGCVRSDDHA